MAGFKIEYTSCCCWEKRVLFCSRRENASVSALIVVVHVVHYYCIDYHYQTRDVEMMKGCIRKVYFEPPKLSSNLLDSIHFRNHYAFVTLRYQNSKYEYTKKTLKIWFMRSFLSNFIFCPRKNRGKITLALFLCFLGRCTSTPRCTLFI